MTTSVSATGNTDTTAAASAMKKATGLNKDDFLKLFITQLKNQDPLNPQDSSQFIAQLAQLTQVEQAYNTNSNLQQLIQANNNANAFNAINLVGKGIIAKGNQVGLDNQGTTSPLMFELPVQASSVTITISDAAGKTVKTVSTGSLPAGRSSVLWDGTNNAGQQLPSGTYSYSVTGKSADGKEIAGTTYVSGKVGSVVMDANQPILSINGVSVPLTDVLSVGA